MPRKITQITLGNDRLVVLCSDGVLWTLDLIDMSRPMEWEELPKIPEKRGKDEE